MIDYLLKRNRLACVIYLSLDLENNMRLLNKRIGNELENNVRI